MSTILVTEDSDGQRAEIRAALEAAGLFDGATRYQVPFAVVIADIDQFKRTNDEYGHAAGDRVLIDVAGQFTDLTRETDLGGRYGGEEFLAVLGRNDAYGAQVFAERFRKAVEATHTQLASGEKVEARVSLGIAEWSPQAESADEIVQRADRALYRAKESGRNRVCIAQPAETDLEESPISV